MESLANVQPRREAMMEASCPRCENYKGPGRSPWPICGQCLLTDLSKFRPSAKALREEQESQSKAEKDKPLREYPILFKGPMVRSILRGTKTATRRLVKLDESGRALRGKKCWHLDDPEAHLASPYGQPGDQLWVKETWCCVRAYPFSDFKRSSMDDIAYRASQDAESENIRRSHRFIWSPSLLMPRVYARLFLEIESTRPERLQAITDEDAIREGAMDWWNETCPAGCDDHPTPREAFRLLWIKINGEESWKANPWVWVICFRSTNQ
jgi:hypothetical protein